MDAAVSAMQAMREEIVAREGLNGLPVDHPLYLTQNRPTAILTYRLLVTGQSKILLVYSTEVCYSRIHKIVSPCVIIYTQQETFTVDPGRRL